MSVHIFQDAPGEWEVWTDCEPGTEKDGRCLASGKTAKQALLAARNEIMIDVAELQILIAQGTS